MDTLKKTPHYKKNLSNSFLVILQNVLLIVQTKANMLFKTMALDHQYFLDCWQSKINWNASSFLSPDFTFKKYVL